MGGSKVGVRLAYALLMIVFDRINHKGTKSLSGLSEETHVKEEREKLFRNLSGRSDNSDCTKANERKTENEVFGIGLDWTEKQTTKGKLSEENNSNSHSSLLLSSSEAMDILTKAEIKLATFRSLASLSDSSSISYRHFPYLDTSLTLFYNAEFTNDRDVEEHDTRIDSILNSWSMSRERIQKDGDCCFRSVARNIMRLTEEGVISPTLNENLTDLGLSFRCKRGGTNDPAKEYSQIPPRLPYPTPCVKEPPPSPACQIATKKAARNKRSLPSPPVISTTDTGPNGFKSTQETTTNR